jgi:hypothetical protein
VSIRPLTDRTAQLVQFLSENDPSKQLFECQPYETRMLVGACVKRQEMLVELRAGNKPHRRTGFSLANMLDNLSLCANCPRGAANAQLLGKEPPFKQSQPFNPFNAQIEPSDLADDLDSN